MIIKTEVTPEERVLVRAKARANGQTVSGYLRARALGDADASTALAPLLKCAEEQAKAFEAIRELTTHAVAAKAVYATEIRALLASTARMEAKMDEILRAATKTLGKGG